MVDTASQAHQAAAASDSTYGSRPYQQNRSGGRSSYGNSHNGPSAGNDSLAMMSQSLQNMNFQDAMYPQTGRNGSIGTVSPQYSSYNLTASVPNPYWSGPVSHQLMVGTQQAYNANGGPHSPAMYTPMTAPYYAHAYGQAQENSPISHGWTSTQASGGEVPTLITPRRESMSSAELESPGTPGYSGYHAMAHNGVAILNRSPNGTYTSTPSPLGMMNSYGYQIAKVPEVDTISPRLKMLVTKEPAIPPAIPAPSSPLKPLDRALENARGETNVYIRGLMPDTTDEMLERWGKRFGDIKSSKSIIDHASGRCKGFGFVRYHNYKDAEDCIRGFHHLGYEVSFARESFYSKLKAIADDGNTNLYVSNLPKAMNEHELASIFTPHKVCSARILRNSNGTGRGVGFARFESRIDCDEVIREFNNKTITFDDEEHTIQIRYADTQEQKHLKQTTAAARQFRSAEYEYATQAHKNGWLQGRSQSSSVNGHLGGSLSGNDFESFMNTSTAPRMQSFDAGWRSGSYRSPLALMSPNDENIRRGALNIPATPLAKNKGREHNDGGVDLDGENAGPPTIRRKDSASSPVRDGK